MAEIVMGRVKALVGRQNKQGQTVWQARIATGDSLVEVYIGQAPEVFHGGAFREGAKICFEGRSKEPGFAGAPVGYEVDRVLDAQKAGELFSDHFGSANAQASRPMTTAPAAPTNTNKVAA